MSFYCIKVLQKDGSHKQLPNRFNSLIEAKGTAENIKENTVVPETFIYSIGECDLG